MGRSATEKITAQCMLIDLLGTGPHTHLSLFIYFFDEVNKVNVMQESICLKTGDQIWIL